MAKKVKQPYDFLFKIVLIGDCGVERFKLMTRFIDGTFTDDFMAGIGIDFKIRIVEVNGKKIKLQIWNPTGGERFHTIVPSYYRGATGIMVVYDITQEKTLDNLPDKWLKKLKEHTSEDVVKMLLGSKCDMEDERMVSKERGETFAKENGMKFLETSAKDNINVEEAFMTMVADILEKQPQKDTDSSGVVKPDTREGEGSRSHRCF